MIFDTKINTSGFDSGLGGMSSKAKSAFGAIGNGIASTAKVAAVGYAAAAAATLTAGVAAVKTGMDFESTMSEVGATSMASAGDMELLTAKAREMGAATVFSATEAAQAMVFMAQAGWGTQDMLGGVEGIMNLASASGEDLALVADIVTDSLTAFGMKANESGRFADVLAQAAASSNTNVAMMGETFKYVAPVAGALGYSVEDAALAIGLMANRGIKGSIAGTALRSTLSRLVKPTKDVTNGMKMLGMNTDISGKSFRELMAEMRGGYKNLTETQKAQVAAMIAGQEGMSGLMAILNASEDEWNNLASAIDNSAGAAKTMSEIRLDNFKGDLTLLKSRLEEVALSIYDKLQPALRDVAKDINGLFDAYEKGGLDGVIKQGQTLIPKILDGLADGGSGFTESLVKILIGAMEGLAEAPNLSSSIATFIGSLLKGATDLLDFTSGDGLSLFEKVFDGLIEGLTGDERAKEFSTALGGLVVEAVKALPDMITGGQEAGKTLAHQIAEGLAEALPEALKQAALSGSEIVGDSGANNANPIVAFFSQGNGMGYKANLDHLDEISDILNDASLTIDEKSKKYQEAMERWNKLVQDQKKLDLDKMIEEDPTTLWAIDIEKYLNGKTDETQKQGEADGREQASSYATGFKAGVQSEFDSEEDWIAFNVANGITDFAPFDEEAQEKAKNAGKEAGQILAKNYLDGMQMGFDEQIQAREYLNSQGVGVTIGVDDYRAQMAQPSAPSSPAAKPSDQLVADIQNNLKAAMEALKANGGLEDTGKLMLEAIVSGMSGETELSALSTAVQGIKDALSGENIEEQFRSAGQSIGEAITNGITAGIASGGASLSSTLTGVVEAAITAAKAQLGIASPSKVTKNKIGIPFAQGIGVGIKKGMIDVKKLVADESVQASLAAMRAYNQSMAVHPMGGIGAGSGGDKTTSYSNSYTFNSPRALDYREMRKEMRRMDQYNRMMAGV